MGSQHWKLVCYIGFPHEPSGAKNFTSQPVRKQSLGRPNDWPNVPANTHEWTIEMNEFTIFLYKLNRFNLCSRRCFHIFLPLRAIKTGKFKPQRWIQRTENAFLAQNTFTKKCLKKTRALKNPRETNKRSFLIGLKPRQTILLMSMKQTGGQNWSTKVMDTNGWDTTCLYCLWLNETTVGCRISFFRKVVHTKNTILENHEGPAGEASVGPPSNIDRTIDMNAWHPGNTTWYCTMQYLSGTLTWNIRQFLEDCFPRSDYCIDGCFFSKWPESCL